MKISNIKYLALSALTASSLFMGCSDEFHEGAYKPSLESHYLDVYPRDFEFGNGEETQTGYVKSENVWSFTSVPAWLSLSPSSGNSDAEFSIASAINEAMSSRTAVFYLSANSSGWSQQRTITASQAAASPSFEFVDLESTSLYLSGESHTLTIEIETNIDDLVAETTPITLLAADGWIAADYNNKKLTISVNANDDGYERRARVELWSSTYSKGGTIYITQYKPNFSFNEITSLSFDADGGNQYVNVSSEIPWFASSNESWIEITPAEGNAGDNQVKITVLPSYQSGSRNGRALFYYRDNPSTDNYISITQTGRYINLTPNAITLSADENSSESVDIDSNIGWNVSSCPNWLVLSQNEGDSGQTTITISAQKNNSLNSRAGTITIQDSNTGGIQTRITVTQNGLDFGDNTPLEFSWHQSSLPLDIPLPRAWSATVSDGWISLSDYAGNGNKTITVSVSKNDAEDLRTGKISFTSEGKTIEVTVIQTGQYIKLDNTSGEFSALGGSLSLTVAASVKTSWAIEYSNPNDKWVHIDKISEEEYSITVDYNPSSLNRSASFILSPTDDDVSDNYVQGVKCTIKQIGRKLTTDKSKIIMFAKGGTSDIVFITCDGSYSIEKDPNDSWYTLVPNYDNNSFYLVVTENTLSMDRNGHVNIMLKDLPQGEEKTLQIEVLQHQPMTNIGFDPFDEDENWNL